MSWDCPYNFQGCDTGSRCRCQEDQDQEDLQAETQVEAPPMSTGYSEEESGYNGK